MINQDNIVERNYTLMISESEINRRMVEIGAQISKKYDDEIPILIGVLNGGFIFLADLIRYIDIDC